MTGMSASISFDARSTPKPSPSGRRRSDNGPGGPHRRWVVPPTDGASMPAGFMLRNRIRYEFVRPEQGLKLNRNGRAAWGLVVATVKARAVDPGPNGLAGLTVTLDGTAPQDRTPACDMKADPPGPGGAGSS